MKSFSFVAHSRNYELTEISSASNYTLYCLKNDFVELGEVEFLSHLSPRFSISKDGQVAIYAGSTVCLPEETELSKYNEVEDIHRVWFLGDQLFFECDTLLSKRLIADFSLTNRYEHDEIVTAGVFQEPKLFHFQDLRNRTFMIDLDSFLIFPSTYPFKKLA